MTTTNTGARFAGAVAEADRLELYYQTGVAVTHRLEIAPEEIRPTITRAARVAAGTPDRRQQAAYLRQIAADLEAAARDGSAYE